MIVNTLTLKNFRNHKFLTKKFSNGINVITGDNAVGKTNVVEAINYLSIAKSFRGVDDIDLIERNSEFAAEIYSAIQEGKITRNIRIIISKNGRQIFINGKKVARVSELAKIVNVVLFEPKDVMFFRGAPKDRRNWLDVALAKKSPTYFEYISKYGKILKERNEILKSADINQNLLDANTEMLVKISAPIVNYRAMYVKDINDILNKIMRALTGEDKRIEITYKPFIPNDSNFEKNALIAFKKSLASDLKNKATSIGVHREDISTCLNGREIGAFGSQGENRLAALALKLAPYFLIEDKDKRPIVILDDVMSELDKTHQERLIKFVSKFEQVFITGTTLKIDGATQFKIEK